MFVINDLDTTGCQMLRQVVLYLFLVLLQYGSTSKVPNTLPPPPPLPTPRRSMILLVLGKKTEGTKNNGTNHIVLLWSNSKQGINLQDSLFFLNIREKKKFGNWSHLLPIYWHIPVNTNTVDKHQHSLGMKIPLVLVCP